MLNVKINYHFISFLIYFADTHVIAKLEPRHIFKIKGAETIVNVIVGKITGDIKKFLEIYADKQKNYYENIGGGTDVIINYSKPLPPDTYGADYPAQEFEMDWKYGGVFSLTSYFNVIVKEGYYIKMEGHTAKDIGDINKFKAIFKTIELEP